MPELHHRLDAGQHHPQPIMMYYERYLAIREASPVSMSCNISRHTQAID